MADITLSQEEIKKLETQVREVTKLPWKFKYAHLGNHGAIMMFNLKLSDNSWAEAQSNYPFEYLYAVQIEGDPMDVIDFYANSWCEWKGHLPWEETEYRINREE